MGRRIALIPARGGSKRIPRKNVKPFAGKPIMAWPMAAAKSCGLFDEVVVSTDDEDIAATARACGADRVLIRPKALADDHTALRPVLRQVITDLETGSEAVTELCCIYATAAFLAPADLVSGFSHLSDNDVDYSVSAVAYAHPVQRAFFENENGGVEMAYPEQRVVRTQDLEPHYHDAGMFFWGRRDAFFTDVSIYTAKSRLVVIPRERGIDIDEPEDWDSAELAFKIMQQTAL